MGANICRTPLVKDCDVPGPDICRTEYESECWTKQEVHDVEDDVVTCTTEVEEKCEDETWLHHQHQVLQVAQGSVLCGEEACEEVHPNHWVHQGTQGAVCSCWLWLCARRRGVL